MFYNNKHSTKIKLKNSLKTNKIFKTLYYVIQQRYNVIRPYHNHIFKVHFKITLYK